MTIPAPIAFGSKTLDFERPLLMGVLNITPDSFSDGGELPSAQAAIELGRRLADAGAQILDVGGESTRPGSEGVDADTEIGRVLPVVCGLAEAGVGVISIDTSKAAVARAALDAGAVMVNDVTSLSDPAMAPLVAEHKAALVLMHMRGEPRTMQQGEIVYDDLLGEIRAALQAAVERATAEGVDRKRILIDPGIGFGKTVEHNLSLSRRLYELASMGLPIVYGPSRKSFLGAVTDRDITDRERATAAACAVAIMAGAHVLRVHDVRAVRDAVAVATAMRDAD